MSKMSVLSLKDTGHVVAAMVEPSAGPPALEALVGSAFPLCNGRARGGSVGFDTSFPLPASLLELKSVAYDGRVIARPQAFAVNGGFVAELPSTNAPTAALADSLVTADAGGNVGSDTKVVVVVTGKNDPRIVRIQAGVIKAGDAAADLNLTIVPKGPAASLPSSDYFVTIAVEGRALTYEAQSI